MIKETKSNKTFNKSSILAVILLCSFITVLLVGCSYKKEVSTKKYIDKVLIYDNYYRPMYSSIINSGKVHATIVHPAKYKVYVKYNKCKFTICGKDAYDYSKLHMNKYVNVKIHEINYDDGTSKIEIVKFE